MKTKTSAEIEKEERIICFCIDPKSSSCFQFEYVITVRSWSFFLSHLNCYHFNDRYLSTPVYIRLLLLVPAQSVCEIPPIANLLLSSSHPLYNCVVTSNFQMNRTFFEWMFRSSYKKCFSLKADWSNNKSSYPDSCKCSPSSNLDSSGPYLPLLFASLVLCMCATHRFWEMCLLLILTYTSITKIISALTHITWLINITISIVVLSALFFSL